MLEVELKSKDFENNVRLILNKKNNEKIYDEDLKSITSLKLNRNLYNDLILGDLSFFPNLESLSIDGVNLEDEDLQIINTLTKLKTLSISNSKLNFEQVKYIKPPLA